VASGGGEVGVRKGDREKFYEGGKIERVREAGLGEKRVT
jgi:hypothetical protein